MGLATFMSVAVTNIAVAAESDDDLLFVSDAVRASRKVTRALANAIKERKTVTPFVDELIHPIDDNFLGNSVFINPEQYDLVKDYLQDEEKKSVEKMIKFHQSFRDGVEEMGNLDRNLN